MMNRRVAYGCALSLILSLPMLAMESRIDEVVAQQLTSANPQSISRIKDIRLVANGNRMKLEIDTVGGTRPQVFFTQQGQSWIGDITNAQLDMGSGSYREESPLPGVSFIEAKQVGSDSVRVQIAGTSAAPQGLLAQRSPTQLVFDFEGLPSAQVAAAPGQATIPVMAPQAPVAQPPAPQPIQPIAQSPAQTPPQPPVSAPAAPASPIISQVPSVGQLNQPQLPPGAIDTNASQFQGRAMAPPAGDLAVGSIIPAPPPIDLGSNANITLTLKDAPVGDVLSLLVRRAGLNVVLNDIPPDMTISLDVADSPLQETFNFILRLKELQASRSGQTVFIGSALPGVGQQIVKTYRLNQLRIEETEQTFDLNASGTAGGGGTVEINATQLSITPSAIRDRIQGILEASNIPLTQPSAIQADPRTNSLTIVATPTQHDVIAAYLAQIDLRSRQVLISARFIEVNLNNGSDLGVALGSASGNFALGSGDNTNFGGTPLNQPAGSSVPNVGVVPASGTGGSLVFNTLNRLQQSLAARIDAAISSGTAKTLADPKVIVANNTGAAIIVGQEVITNRRLQTDPATGTSTVVFEKGNAGVNLIIQNVRIDDNGYITLNLLPQISSIDSQITLSDGTVISLLNQRSVGTLQTRLKDRETLFVGGLIQEEDRVSVDKVPLLSEIPLLGSLFRRQSTTNNRSEVVVLITPFILEE
ncbi:AMIN domain-containing protein [Synechococcus sp. Nb3U1]|uniref:AMIN domain-containing protein n=1 Tax=Synechococcus sp. Nb3U1 TaxID=1914529 RepID=UPI001F2C2188|nr:AMIN domain-containing protein [Synechococcus sp. Nb3U1]MCF2972224.1 AMIN domain-containing protein [Synechococcus sp. Nb3U1]